MPTNDLQHYDDGFNLFNFIESLLTNKKTILIFLSISIISGLIFNYNLPSKFQPKDKSSVYVNILLRANKIYTYEEMGKKIKDTILSSYSYEKWSDQNNLTDLWW